MMFKQILAAIAATCLVAAAALSGALMALRTHVSQNVSQDEASPVVPDVLPPSPVPFVLHEQYLTDWQGLSNGATRDARKVRTTAIPAIGTPFPAK